MLFTFMEKYCKELAKSYKRLDHSTNAALSNEKSYRENIEERERALAEIDEQDMDDEEIETNVKILAESSPYKRKVNEDIKRVLKVMNNG